MVLCLVTSTDLLTRRAGLSASAELIGTNVYKRFYRATLCLNAVSRRPILSVYIRLEHVLKSCIQTAAKDNKLKASANISIYFLRPSAVTQF